VILLFAIVLVSIVTLPLVQAQSSDISCSIDVSQPLLRSPFSPGLLPATAGHHFVLTVTATNCSEEPVPFTALIEVRNSIGVTEYIGWQSGILEGDGQTEIGLSWIPSYGDYFEVRSFAISGLQMPLVLSTVSTTHVQIAEQNAENLVLEFNTTKTNVSTTEVFGTSYYVVNKGRLTLPIAIHDYIGVYRSDNGATRQRLGPEVSCIWRWSSEIGTPDAVLKPGQMTNLTDRSNQSSAPRIPGIYSYTPFVVASVQTDERVKCLEILGNTIEMNVTAPVYEGVQLVIETDKQSYHRGENVTLQLYIENNSDRLFETSEIVPMVKIVEESIGADVYSASFVADYSEYPVVHPHSNFTLFPQLVWSQTTFQQDGTLEQANPGRYVISATFTYPYLESEEYAITIEHS
jgi:hypothetical protein